MIDSQRRRGWLAGVTFLALLCASAASAQLNQSCTVSALNRTAQVAADGSWVLPNVPSTFGRLRVRATCVENGVVRSGQSSYFTLSTNEVLRVSDISFVDPQPVPATLALSAPAASLTSPGQTLQLQAAVTLPDGATRDVTLGATGTNYTVSNLRTATVSPDGLVTAVASGTVLVSASNEGALGVLRLQVALSGDSDGDGLPDDYELAHGLDPNNPADVLEDPDHDGLSTLDEFRLGTDPFKADSDGDGLSDGDEVNLYHTNPLLADTDGDGVSDGLEVRVGSNPLDPNSVNLAGILSGITVTPQSFTLVFNTVLGEASRGLNVRGQLIDGTSLDIAAPRYGTTYLSSNLAIASFGAEPGRVFAGQSGTATVTVRNNGFTAAVQVTVQTFGPTALAFLPLPGATNGVAVAGNYAYVAGGSAGLNVVDVTNLQHPVLAATRSLPGTAYDLAADASGLGFLYVAAGDAGLQVVDVRIPTAPVVVGAAHTAGPALDVVVKGSRAYVADSVGLRIFDLTNPAAPALLGGVSTGGRARGVDVSDTYAVVAAESAGVFVVDLSDPTQPHVVGSTGTRNFGGSNAAAVTVRGREAYVADGATTLGGLKVINFSVPSTPVVVGATSDSFGLSDVATDGRFVLAADYYFVNTVPIFDLSLLPPVFNARLDFDGAPAFRDDNGQGIAIADGVVFLAADRCLLFRFGTVGCGGLYIGRYLLGEQDGTVAEPPTVAVTSPTAGAQVHERNTLEVTASASGEVRVTSVQFLVNGQPAFIDYASPFTYSFSVPAGTGSLTLGAVATDVDGHQATAAPVTVQVLPDDKPTVTLLAPVPGSRFTEGATIPLAATASDDVRVASVEFFVDGVSQGVGTTEPYQVSYTIPLGKTQLTIRAVATDSAGQTATTSDVTVGVDRDPPPVVTVLDPPAGATVVEGAQITVSVGATDNTAITRVQLSIGGQTPLQKTSPPYTFTVDVPLGAGQLSFTASATDTVGQVSTATSTLTVTADPLTTAVGRVLDPDGNPVAGANVSSGAVIGTTLADGTFSLPGLPSTRAIVVSASATIAGKVLSGRSLPTPPVPGGTTYVGDITNLGTVDITCGEAVCVPVQGTYVSHFSGPGCTGTESYYLPYDFYAYSCRTWNGTGQCGTIRRTVTNYSARINNGPCQDLWPSGNTLSDFVTVYRSGSTTPVTYSLNVTLAGSALGMVTSDPSGIDCGTTCSADFTSGTIVTLTATAVPGSIFTRWSGGGCSGTQPCTITLLSSQSVSAIFDILPGGGCGEALCVPAQGIYVSHFSGPGCTGTESYYLPYDNFAYSCRTWDGSGQCGTIHRTVTNFSARINGGPCQDLWPSGNTLSDFVTVYR